MKLSERLLEIFDAKVAAEREQISAQAPDIDALGEILASAHYAGLEIQPERIYAQGDSILLTCGARDEAVLAWMLRSGFSLKAADPSDRYVHNRLTHPRLTCLVTILTSKEGEVRA
ncbi:hypothetical protein [Cupriavidus necator]|uniref:hypothetical protein n=1 Tax=Cupriavidus necator TaxID=106590 RepID=UPI0005B2EF00|nr:hypothetical protein [Cupriavidus necator]